MSNNLDTLMQRVLITDGCWLWQGKVNHGGYGYFSITSPQKTTLAHRAMWIFVNGLIPDSLHVLHNCDVPACVNPDHLRLGTNAENIKDRVERGRTVGYVKQDYCKHGHLFTDETTGWQGPNNKWKYCKPCRKAAQQKWWAERPNYNRERRARLRCGK